jgi:DNA-binding NarL/FixJ family response regulator
MIRLILADDQSIFRAGAARVLALEDDIRLVAQCDDAQRLKAAIEAHKGAVILFSNGITLVLPELVAAIAAAGSRAILILENTEQVDEVLTAQLHGLVYRSVTGNDLIECVRKVHRGQRCLQAGNVTVMHGADSVGTRVRDRLTPKEIQIVALIVQGCKNKDIATQLGTKEQVIKNYLRGIYDKTGVSDRLELALFTIHHKVLAEAAANAGRLLQMKSA